MSAPPPPPPHGEAPKTAGGGSGSGSGGLPPGNYDIFVIPEHSAGAGFLYLPSLRPNINSFVAGFASALALMALGNSMAPAFRVWWSNFQGMGNMGMIMLVIAVGLGAWSLGRIQQDDAGAGGGKNGGGSSGGGRGGAAGSASAGPSPRGSPRGTNSGAGANAGAGTGSTGGTGANNTSGYSSSQAPPPQQQQHENRPPPESGPQPHAPPPYQNYDQQHQQQQQQQQREKEERQREEERQRQQQQQWEKPKPTWQQSQQQNYQRQAPPQKPSTPKTDSNKGAWEKAREEMRRKEEERKAQEAEKRRREEVAAKLREIRERETRERLERERREQEEKDRRERERKETRDKELRERLAREQREKELKEQRERIEKELREKIEQEQREKLERERILEQEQRARELKEKLRREQLDREAREARAEEQERRKKAEEEEEERKRELDRLSRKGTAYAFSAVGERTNPWPNGKPPTGAAPPPKGPASAPSVPPTGAAGPRSGPPPRTAPPTSSYNAQAGGPAAARKPPPTAAASSTGGPSRQAHVQDEEETTYSFRPYDKPKRPQPARKKSVSEQSDASWAPSQSTARTTPPPSMRQPYTTNDPDKIVIRGVYGFLNQFAKTPSSQLLSGVGSVTDGLILRITTEGLFIDDDVRGVPQREWDVKAWTLKLVEVWCPAHAVALARSAHAVKPPRQQPPSASNAAHAATFLHRAAWRKAAAAGARGEPRPLTDDQADAYLADLLRECKALCGLGLCGDTGVVPSAFDDSASASPSASSFSSAHHSASDAKTSQTGTWQAKGLHLLRATVRDQEGKRFLFVLRQEEAWKVAMGLQRLRRGTQVRSLGVAGLTSHEVRGTLELLGWT